MQDIFVCADDIDLSGSVLAIVLFSFIIVISSSQVLHAGSITNDELPVEAGICVSQASSMVKKGNIHKAITLLENFKAKQNRVDVKTALKKGYAHYYIDFLLGNYYMMLSSDAGSANPQLEKQYKKNAAVSYRNAVTKKPDLNPGWLNLAKCLYELKDMAMAAKAFVKGYDTGKKKSGIYLYYASICFANSKDSKNALKYAVFLTKKYPLEPKWWKALASLYLKNNDLKHGLAALVSYGFLAPLKNDEILLAANLYLSLNIPSKAAFYYEKLLHKKKDKRTINKIVYAYMQTRQTEKALQWIDEGLALYQSDKDLLKKKAALNALIKFEDQAIPKNQAIP